MVKMKLSDFSLVKCTGGVNVVFDSEPSRVCSQSQFFLFSPAEVRAESEGLRFDSS